MKLSALEYFPEELRDDIKEQIPKNSKLWGIQFDIPYTLVLEFRNVRAERRKYFEMILQLTFP